MSYTSKTPANMSIQTVPLKMAPPASSSGSGSGSRGAQSSRSSRRRMGSGGAPVILGGGAGALGRSDGPNVSCICNKEKS
jgi:hypothetical protein